MPQFLYLLKPTRLGMLTESTFGIAVLEADHESAARTIMDSDPAIRSGVMRASLYPYRVALMRAQNP